MAEKGFEVSASEIRGRWPWMNEMERMDFASNFHVKETWTENDSEVLGILMNDGDDNIWGTCALAMLRHPDQNRAVEFLIERVKRNESAPPATQLHTSTWYRWRSWSCASHPALL
jgi:hypothetical protein